MHFKLVKYLGVIHTDEFEDPVETLQSVVQHWVDIYTGVFFSILKMLISQTQRALKTNTKYVKIMILFTAFSNEFLNKIQMHLFSKGYKGVSIMLCSLSCNSIKCYSEVS